MKSRTFANLFSALLLVTLVLSACGTPSTPVPATSAPLPTNPPAATQAPTQPPAATQASTQASAATQAPTQPPAPSATTATTAPKTLRVGALADDYRQDAKDPGRVNVGMATVNANIFDQLTSMDTNFQVQPMLAESWEYDTPTATWRFHLRHGVKFHNGQPFTADAVVQDIKRVAAGGYATILGIDANSAKAVDDFTVDIKPVHTNLLLPAQIAHPIFGIPAPGSDLLKEQIGTGPFKMVEYVKNDHLTVSKNADYWGTPAAVDRIVFRFYPDPNTRVLALQAGDVDLIYDVPRESAAQLKSDSNLQVLNSKVSAYQSIGVMLTGSAPYTIGQDSKVREAIGYAIDRKAIIATAFGGFATDSQTIIPAGVLDKYAGLVQGYTYDVSKAKSLLDEAGWKDPSGTGIRSKNGKPLMLELVSGFPDGPSNGQTPEVIQAQLRAVGIDLKITSVPDDPAYEARLTNKQGDLWLEIGNQNTPAPCFLLGFLFNGRDPAPNIWENAFAPATVGFSSFDDELAACTSTANLDQAHQHAGNAMHILIDQARAVIPLVGVFRIWAATNKVQGFDPHPVMIYVRWGGVSLQP